MTIVAAGSLALAAMASAAAGGWQMVWSDEFDGNAIDRSKWSLAVDCWGGGNNERQCYVDDPANASVADGILTITARRRDVTGPALPADQRSAATPDVTKTLSYSSAKLLSKGKASWTYGRFEIRARLPSGQGTWPAIWMLPEENHYGPWAASGEIDILETVNLGAPCGECPGGRENRILGTLHFGGKAPENKHKGDEMPYPDILDGAFHVFVLEWSPRHMVWKVDGKQFAERSAGEWSTTASSAAAAPFDRPFHLILNLAVGGGLAESRNLKTVDAAVFPARLDVDYVRVWQCAGHHDSMACSQ